MSVPASPTTSAEVPMETPVIPQPKAQCRAIRTDGQRCRANALDGLHLCWSHYHHRFPALADPDHISIPFLEDAASIQLLMTQVAHGLLSRKLDPIRARTTIWAAQVAASTFPRPPRLKALVEPEPPGEPVRRIGFDHESFISADGDLADLNHLCSVPATPQETWDALDTVRSVNQVAPELRYTDPYHPAPPSQPLPPECMVPHPLLRNRGPITNPISPVNVPLAPSAWRTSCRDTKAAQRENPRRASPPSLSTIRSAPPASPPASAPHPNTVAAVAAAFAPTRRRTLPPPKTTPRTPHSTSTPLHRRYPFLNAVR